MQNVATEHIHSATILHVLTTLCTSRAGATAASMTKVYYGRALRVIFERGTGTPLVTGQLVASPSHHHSRNVSSSRAVAY